mmetsp:Transcript_6759/g.11348  ORF Transcript_6759/g.11348 Transcript_6759/m.11348 type:complete len:98 (-) Transcript_6759:284-577(-)
MAQDQQVPGNEFGIEVPMKPDLDQVILNDEQKFQVEKHIEDQWNTLTEGQPDGSNLGKEECHEILKKIMDDENIMIESFEQHFTDSETKLPLEFLSK